MPATFGTCQKIVSASGNIVNVGVHGKPVQLHIEELWIENINISKGLVCAKSTLLLRTPRAGKGDAKSLITHRFKLDEIIKAYDVIANAAREKAMKAVLAACVRLERIFEQGSLPTSSWYLHKCTFRDKRGLLPRISASPLAFTGPSQQSARPHWRAANTHAGLGNTCLPQTLKDHPLGP